MSIGSKIEWTEATWSPTTGCDRVSPGCDNCYAMTLAKRLKGMGQSKYQRDGDPRTSGPGFGLTLHPDVLDIPLRRKKPTTWFVDSMSDLFHPEVPEEFIREVFVTMCLAQQHTFQILTKRPQRMRDYLCDLWDAKPAPDLPSDVRLPREIWKPWPNVWLGTSIESDRYTFRADHLRATPAAIRFLSLEPLLGPLPSLDLTEICPTCNGERLLPVPGGATSCETCFRGPLGVGESQGTVPRFDWVIVGGESGPGARPMHPDWVRDIRDRCIEAGVAFFFKQWGAWVPGQESFVRLRSGVHTKGEHLPNLFLDREGDERHTNELTRFVIPEGWERLTRVGKKAAGRTLDGRTWDEMPERVSA